jgi:carbonic anhydrase
VLVWTVTWYVIKTEIGIQPEEIDEIGRFARQEARHVQPLDRRLVLRNFK